jgi:enoyl-CoA hydratase
MWDETRHGPVAVATFRNPPMNYHTDAAVEQLDELISGWASEDVRAVVLGGGTPGKFITHFDVDAILRNQEAPDPIVDAPRRSIRVQTVLSRLTTLPKPVIAALNGDTMGFGFELSLSCDLRIGERGDYRYGLPEVRLGIIPGGSGTTRMTRLLGTARALDLIIRARVLTPDDALDLGLVHELADDGLEAAMAIAADVAALPPLAVAMAKKVIYDGSDLPLDIALKIETEGSFRSKQSPEAATPMMEYLSLPLERRRAWLEGREASVSNTPMRSMDS